MTETITVPEFDLADRMRKALRESQHNVIYMAEQLGVRRETVSSWLNGRTRPIGPAVRMWAMLTGVPLEWLETGHVAGLSASVHPSGLEPETRWFAAFVPDQQRCWTLAA